MSASVTYTCDRCSAIAEIATLATGAVPLPEHWVNTACDGMPLRQLCGKCRVGLEDWFAYND